MAFLLELMTPLEFMVCFGIVLIAAILQMSIGMGFGMLASPLIAIVKPEIVPGCILLIGLVVAASGLWKERGNVRIEDIKMGFGGRIVGSLTAFTVLIFISDIQIFMIVFGALMLVAVLLTASGIRMQFNNGNLFQLSILSGLMGTITAVGAPPMAIIYHNQPPQIVRPTLNAFFGASCVFGLVTLTASGWLSLDDLLASVLLFPALLLGIYFSRYFRNLPAKLLSQFLLGLSGAASGLLILRGLFG